MSRSLRWTWERGLVFYRVLVRRPQTKGLLVRPRHRWEDDIKMDLQYVGWGMDWINVAQESDRKRAFVNAALNHRVP